jgi:hypothetical protein
MCLPCRPAHPDEAQGLYGMVELLDPPNTAALAEMRKQMAPFMYAGGIHAFACCEHMLAAPP